MPARRVPRTVVAAAAVVAFVACRPEASAGPADPASTGATDTSATTATTATTTVPAEAMAAADLTAISQRCVDAATVLDERIEAEDVELPEEAELDDEELEEVMTPALEFDDGVAGPDERPVITPMPDFDPTTVPILELDLMVESCIENGIVTEAELFGDEGDDAEFCAELRGQSLVAPDISSASGRSRCHHVSARAR